MSADNNKNRPSSASSSQSGGGVNKGFQSKRASTPTGAGSGLAELMRSNPATFSFDTNDFSMDIFPTASIGASQLPGGSKFSIPSTGSVKRPAISTPPPFFQRTGENPSNTRGGLAQASRPHQFSTPQQSTLSGLQHHMQNQRLPDKLPARKPLITPQSNRLTGSVPTSSLTSSAVTSPAAHSNIVELEDTEQMFARVQEIKTEAFQILGDYENNFQDRINRLAGCKRKSSELIERTELDWEKIARRKSALKESVELLRENILSIDKENDSALTT